MTLPERFGKVAGGFGKASIRILRDVVMILRWMCCWKSPGISFEAGQCPRARAPGRWRVLWRRVQRALGGSRKFSGFQETLGKVGEGFGEVLVRFYEVQERPVGGAPRRDADFRSLKR